MPTLGPEALVDTLRSPALQVRTGVILAPVETIGRGQDLAARLGIDWADYVTWKLAQLAPNTRYLGLTANELLQDLDRLVQEPYQTACTLALNADVLLARLTERERERVWGFLFESFKKRPTALIILLPEEATHLFTASQRNRWEVGGRLTRVTGGGGGEI